MTHATKPLFSGKAVAISVMMAEGGGEGGGGKGGQVGELVWPTRWEGHKLGCPLSQCPALEGVQWQGATLTRQSPKPNLKLLVCKLTTWISAPHPHTLASPHLTSCSTCWSAGYPAPNPPAPHLR